MGKKKFLESEEKHIVIVTCGQCTHANWMTNENLVCSYRTPTHKLIAKLSDEIPPPIPSWCPLEDADE
jgi:hypothetical protein